MLTQHLLDTRHCPRHWNIAVKQTKFYNFVLVIKLLSHVATLCDLMDCSTPGFPVIHHLQEFVQVHIH